VAYLRISTDADRQAHGLDVQRRAVEAWALAAGVAVVAWCQDELSGRTSAERRPGLGAALVELRQRQAGRLIVSYELAGAVKRVDTDDEGASYSVPTTIFAAGEHPTFCISPTGVEHHFAYSGGAIKTKTLGAQGNTLIAETTVVASGVDDDSIAAEWRDGYIVLLYVVSGAVTTKRSSDGTTFS
jgi:hypothetical protein